MVVVFTSLIVPLWLFYLNVQRSASAKLHEISIILKRKRSRLSKSFLEMMASETSEAEIGRIIDLCILPLRDIVDEVINIKKEYYDGLKPIIRAFGFMVAALIIIFEAFVTAVYITSEGGLTVLEFVLAFGTFSVLGLSSLTLYVVYPEWYRERRARKLLEFLDLLDESAKSGRCLDGLEELLEEL